MDRRTALLNAALDKVTGKADDYDKPEDSFKEIAEAWSWWKGVPFSTKDVSMMMALLKMSRLKHSPDHYDSVLDLAGYAACYADLLPESPPFITPEAREKLFKSEGPPFKEGDLVVLRPVKEYLDNEGLNQTDLDGVLTVQEIRRSKGNRFKWLVNLQDRLGGWDAERFRHATAAEIGAAL